jgi:hypothetical protein
MASLMKDDVNDEVPSGIPKILIPSDGVVNWDGMLKSRDRPKGDHATHLLGWIEKPIAWNSIWKCICK